jgi:hypothetical protein
MPDPEHFEVRHWKLTQIEAAKLSGVVKPFNSPDISAMQYERSRINLLLRLTLRVIRTFVTGPRIQFQHAAFNPLALLPDEGGRFIAFGRFCIRTGNMRENLGPFRLPFAFAAGSDEKHLEGAPEARQDYPFFPVACPKMESSARNLKM